MWTNKVRESKALTNDELTERLKQTIAASNMTTAELLVDLAEVDVRRLYVPAGFSSTYSYCMEELGLSEGAAYKRIGGARLARRYPVIFEMVADGKLHLAALMEIKGVLTDDNHAAVLQRASGMTKRQAERLRTELDPQPAVATSLRKLPAPRQAPMTQPVPATAAPTDDAAPAAALATSTTPACERPAPTGRCAPLAPQRYKLTVTLDEEDRRKLDRIVDLLGHQLPSGDVGSAVKRAIGVLHDKLEAQKLGRSKRPRKSVARRSESSGGRHIPAAVRRQVADRDGDRCTFVSADGHHCSQRRALEFHHLDARGFGGPPTVENITLRCAAHNRYAAEQDFGLALMDAYRNPPTGGQTQPDG